MPWKSQGPPNTKDISIPPGSVVTWPSSGQNGARGVFWESFLLFNERHLRSISHPPLPTPKWIGAGKHAALSYITAILQPWCEQHLSHCGWWSGEEFLVQYFDCLPLRKGRVNITLSMCRVSIWIHVHLECQKFAGSLALLRTTWPHKSLNSWT